MKLTFQATDDEGTVITHESDCPVWYLALDQFVKFLRGCGYDIENNSVGINISLNHYGIEDYPLANITTFEEE